MIQSDLAKKVSTENRHLENNEDLNMVIESTDVMTGDQNKSRFLYYQLKMSIMRAKQIDIIVSFLMESGVRMILKDLKSALERGVKVRILTGNYLGITQPSALYLIKKDLGNLVDLRFYNDHTRAFHPKSVSCTFICIPGRRRVGIRSGRFEGRLPLCLCMEH